MERAELLHNVSQGNLWLLICAVFFIVMSASIMAANMVTRLKQLTLKIKLTLYICQPNEGKMYTIHEGKSFEGELPEWLARFVAGDEPLLPFEQDGLHKIYVRWVLNADNTIVFLDDAKLSCLMLLLNNLLAQSPAIPKSEEASAVEIRMLTEKLQQMKLSYEAELAEAQQQISALNASNLEQKARLKEALSNAISDIGASRQPTDGLHNIIEALNKVIKTGDATNLNIEALNLVVSTPPQAELEQNPEAVKAVIAKLMSMERSGQLTAFQIKKLNSVMK